MAVSKYILFPWSINKTTNLASDANRKGTSQLYLELRSQSSQGTSNKKSSVSRRNVQGIVEFQVKMKPIY